MPRSDTSLVALLSKENKCYLILDIRLCNVVKEDKDCNLKGWGQTMITFLPPLRSMLLPLHPLQPELHRKQCVRVYWCVSIDIRPVIILSHAKNQTCTLSFLQNCFCKQYLSPQDPHRWHCTWHKMFDCFILFIIFIFNKSKHSHLLQSFLFDRLFIWLLWGAPRDLKLFNLKLMFSKAITEFWIIIWGPYGLLRKIFLQCVAASCRWKLK